jgi:hypothetical protein
MQKLENFFFFVTITKILITKVKRRRQQKRIDRKGIHKQGESEEVPKGKKQRDQTQFK